MGKLDKKPCSKMPTEWLVVIGCAELVTSVLGGNITLFHSLEADEEAQEKNAMS